LTEDEGAAATSLTAIMRYRLHIWQVFPSGRSFGIQPSFIRSSFLLDFGEKTDRFAGFLKESVKLKMLFCITFYTMPD
jgi:hypothetical protein